MRYKGLITWDSMKKSFDFEADKIEGIANMVGCMLSGMQMTSVVSFTCSFYGKDGDECNFSMEGTCRFFCQHFQVFFTNLPSWVWLGKDTPQHIWDYSNIDRPPHHDA